MSYVATVHHEQQHVSPVQRGRSPRRSLGIRHHYPEIAPFIALSRNAHAQLSSCLTPTALGGTSKFTTAGRADHASFSLRKYVLYMPPEDRVSLTSSWPSM